VLFIHLINNFTITSGAVYILHGWYPFVKKPHDTTCANKFSEPVKVVTLFGTLV